MQEDYKQAYNDSLFSDGTALLQELQYLDAEDFTLMLRRLLEENTPHRLLSCIEAQRDSFLNYPELYELARMILLEELLLDITAEVGYSCLDEQLSQYSEAAYKYMLLMYQEDFLKVPDSCRFALYYLQSKEEQEAGHIRESLLLKKEAAKAYPVLLPAIQAFIGAYSQQLK